MRSPGSTGAGEARGQSLDARQVGGMRDALGAENEGDAVWVKARVALHDVEQREITQPHLGVSSIDGG